MFIESCSNIDRTTIHKSTLVIGNKGLADSGWRKPTAQQLVAVFDWDVGALTSWFHNELGGGERDESNVSEIK